jgi:hypothetical protein
MENNTTTWTVKVEEDTDTGELILPLPLPLLEKIGWVEGDVLKWEETENGSWILTKRDKNA